MPDELQDAEIRATAGPTPEVAPSACLRWIDFLLPVLVIMLVVMFLYRPVRVEGTSMLPVLEDQDRMFINKFAYTKLGSMVGQSIQRGDVVVFEYPRDVSKSYVKRVIGMPGDVVRIDHGQVYVNDVALKEPYVPMKYTDERSVPELVVGPDRYFVMGDHRSVSSDSRDFGTVGRKYIYGRAAFVYWPVDQAGIVH